MMPLGNWFFLLLFLFLLFLLFLLLLRDMVVSQKNLIDSRCFLADKLFSFYLITIL